MVTITYRSQWFWSFSSRMCRLLAVLALHAQLSASLRACFQLQLTGSRHGVRGVGASRW